MYSGNNKESEDKNTSSSERTVSEKQYKSLLLLVKKLQLRIEEMEASKFWKLKKLYIKSQTFLKSRAHEETNKSFLGRMFFLFTSRGRKAIRKVLLIIFKNLYLWLEENPVSIMVLNESKEKHGFDNSYSRWREKNVPNSWDLEEMKANAAFFPYQPLISIIVPVYNTPVSYLKEMVRSVEEQVYGNWQLCIADDCSLDDAIRKELIQYSEKDSRIQILFLKENVHISACSNAAFSLVTGEYTGLLDHDDLLAPDALYEVVRLLNLKRDADFIYSDEDKITEMGQYTDPHFKPDWCPENLLSRNYISHFAVIRSTLIRKVNGFREGFEGSQDYDLYLRISEITNAIYHIPKVLYHWRMHENSVALDKDSKSYAFESGIKALNEALVRRSLPGYATLYDGLPGYYDIRLQCTAQKKISIIIATKDKSEILRTCLDSIYKKSSYRNFEIILISNNSEEKETEILLNQYSSKHAEFHKFVYDIPFNFSALMNFGASKATGDFLIFLNNDTEVIASDWMEALMEQCQRTEIGVAGSKLLYPDNTIQHAGVIIGLGGIAGHCMVAKHRDDQGYFSNLICLTNYSAVTGAAFMCRKEVFDKVKGFDEKYEVEFNDIDFCLRVKELGFRNVYVPDSLLYHHESLTRGNPLANEKSIARHTHEKQLFEKSWNRYMKEDPCYNRNLSLYYTDYRLRE